MSTTDSNQGESPMAKKKTGVAGNAKATKRKMLGGITGKGFLPGQSGNPEGGRLRKPLTAALEQIYSDPKEAMAAAKALAAKVRKGSVAHWQEAANRIEGKVTETMEAKVGIRVVVIKGDDPQG
jgi:hypothetical protein